MLPLAIGHRGAQHQGQASFRNESYPRLDSLRTILLGDQPLTPAWSCSPFTLALVHYMLDKDQPGLADVLSETEWHPDRPGTRLRGQTGMRIFPVRRGRRAGG